MINSLETIMKYWSHIENNKFAPIVFALLAALLFGLNAPLSKLFLSNLSPMYMVAFLYLGAGIGMLLLHMFTHGDKPEAPLTVKEMPWTVSMILLDVLAPFLLMWGLKRTSAANASLLFNFEMVATSLIALCFFKESIGRRMWFSIGIITVASILLSIDFSDVSTWEFSSGSLFVIAACGCWGMENNCTRNISEKSPAEIVIVKGIGSGMTALVIAMLTGNPFPHSFLSITGAVLLGFVAYGLSIFLYVKAQRYLGAARTSAYYAAAPFMGILLSMAILKEIPGGSFAVATGLMLCGVWLAVREKHIHEHVHERLEHNHAHLHDDLHHNHEHYPPINGWHSHEHVHESCTHIHQHSPDIHHRHQHC